MRNLFKIIAVTLMFSACTMSPPKGDYSCPRVDMPRISSSVTQIVNYSEEIRIELIGFEQYCSTENYVDRRYSAIKPLFRVKRLTSGSDTRIDFSFFTETIKGPPEFLGRKTYRASVDIPRDVKEKDFSAPHVKVRIPAEEYRDFTIILGMNIDAAERDYNSKNFDVEYKYLDDEEYAKRNLRVEPRVVEVEKAPDIQYIKMQPISVYQSEPKSKGCNSCGL